MDFGFQMLDSGTGHVDGYLLTAVGNYDIVLDNLYILLPNQRGTTVTKVQAQPKTTLPQREVLLRRMICVCDDVLVVSILHQYMALFAGQQMSGPEVLAMLGVAERLLASGTASGSSAPTTAREHFGDYLEVLIDDEAAFAQAKAALEESTTAERRKQRRRLRPRPRNIPPRPPRED